MDIVYMCESVSAMRRESKVMAMIMIYWYNINILIYDRYIVTGNNKYINIQSKTKQWKKWGGKCAIQRTSIIKKCAKQTKREAY